ncbi:MAG: hypothetical protein LBG75_00080 [Candidatus Nomurabacteria bacterium]|jgi:diacylglycerol kinase family enzyme|nr:hypothetical protein [Candidatus Nomurabacteria bacterium]
MQARVVLVSNPRSSNYRKVERQVLMPLKQLTENLIEYKIVHTFFEDNVQRISRLLREGDTVIAAGGDGTVAIAINAIMATGFTSITFGALAYGNFNDLSTAFSGRGAKVEQLLATRRTVKFWPLDIFVNGEHFRYSTMYADIGLVAGSVNEFEKGPERRRLRNGWANQLLSFMALVPYYRKHKKTYQLPSSNLGDECTDFFAINGSRMAKFKVGPGFSGGDRFGTAMLDTRSLLRNIPFATRSIFGKMPLSKVKGSELEFKNPAKLDFQADGEYRKLEGVKKLSFTKPAKHINLIKLTEK